MNNNELINNIRKNFNIPPSLRISQFILNSIDYEKIIEIKNNKILTQQAVDIIYGFIYLHDCYNVKDSIFIELLSEKSEKLNFSLEFSEVLRILRILNLNNTNIGIEELEKLVLISNDYVNFYKIPLVKDIMKFINK